jgi:hypothetical protein
MLCRGRPADDRFDDNEFVFFRWFNDHLEDGEIRPANMTTPDQSMNRSRFRGRCWHVLIPDPGTDPERAKRWLCRGVVRASAAVFAVSIEQGTVLFEFRVEHDPLEHNYGHCELRVYRNGKRLPKDHADKLRSTEKKAWKAAEKWFRTEMGKAVRKRIIRIVLRPEIGTRSS